MTKDSLASSGLSGPVPADVRTRLAALTYLILPPSLGHSRRAAIAHRNVAQALGPGLTDKPDQPLGPDELARLRVRVLRLALGAGYRSRVPRPSMASRTGEAGARDKALAALIPAARAAYALRRVEGVGRDETVGLLAGAGVSDPETAVRVSERLSPGVPPMSPSDVPTPAWLARRRRRAAGALATACVVLLGGGLAIVPGSDGGEQLPAGSTGAKTSATRPAADTAAATTAKAPAKRAKIREAAATSGRRSDAEGAASRATRSDAEQAAATRAAQAARAAEAEAARRAAAAAAVARAVKVAQATPATARETAGESVQPTAAGKRAAAAREAEAAALQQARQAAANRKAAANAERVRDPSLPDGGEVGTAPAVPASTGGTPAGSDPAVP